MLFSTRSCVCFAAVPGGAELVDVRLSILKEAAVGGSWHGVSIDRRKVFDWNITLRLRSVHRVVSERFKV